MYGVERFGNAFSNWANSYYFGMHSEYTMV